MLPAVRRVRGGVPGGGFPAEAAFWRGLLRGLGGGSWPGSRSSQCGQHQSAPQRFKRPPGKAGHDTRAHATGTDHDGEVSNAAKRDPAPTTRTALKHHRSQWRP